MPHRHRAGYYTSTMANRTSFEQHLIDMVRQMPAEALLELVQGQLGVVGAATGRQVRPSRRASRNGHALTDAAVLGVVTAGQGLSLGEVAAAVGAEKAPTRAALRRLMERGAVHMAGERRFARYATTAAGAKAASRRARRG